LGWHDGRNIEIDHRFSGSGRERIRANAKELIALNPDVIVTVGGPSLAAVLAETRTIPVVFVVVSDPVVSGFVSNLAHPGGNVTGFAVSEAGIAGKWLQLLKEIAPRVSRALVIMEAESQPQQVMRDAVAVAAPALAPQTITSPLAIEGADSSFTGIDFVPDAFVGGPVRPGAVLYSLEGDFGFSPENATSPAPVIGHEVKLINFNQVLGSPLALRIENFARNSTGDQAFVTPNINGFNRPTNVRFGPDGCAYVADYGAVRDQGADSHVVGTGNGSLVQIPGTGVVWKICPM
jgi:ABC transporter substrate binding protein